MTRRRAADPIGFGSGISTDHKDGIRWVDYSNISWNPVFCKRCDICVEICPKATLVLRNDAIIEEENCILCGLCEPSAASALKSSVFFVKERLNLCAFCGRSPARRPPTGCGRRRS